MKGWDTSKDIEGSKSERRKDDDMGQLEEKVEVGFE